MKRRGCVAVCGLGPYAPPIPGMKAQLAQSFAEKPLTEDRWSARRSLAFMVVVNGVFWGGLVMMAKALLPAHL